MTDQPSKESLERAIRFHRHVAIDDGDACLDCVRLALEFDAVAAELRQQNAALVSALRGALKAADELMTEFISKKRAAKWGIINDGLYKAECALVPYASAEEKEKA